MIYTGMHTR